MARCKDCIHGEICTIFAHTRTLVYEDKADKICKMFKSIADVVPKSEVEQLQKQFKEFDGFDVVPRSEAKERVLFAQKEVAREIFEEIEAEYGEQSGADRGDELTYGHLQDFIAKLKKKYTEERI